MTLEPVMTFADGILAPRPFVLSSVEGRAAAIFLMRNEARSTWFDGSDYIETLDLWSELTMSGVAFGLIPANPLTRISWLRCLG